MPSPTGCAASRREPTIISASRLLSTSCWHAFGPSCDRRHQMPDLWIAHGDVSVDVAKHRALRAGHPLDLTAKELALLTYFLRHPGQVLSRTRIYDHVWDENFDLLSNTLEVHIMELRRKLEAHGPRVIQTVRGRGYIFDATRCIGGDMSLAGRFSAFFLSVLALVLLGFSLTLYISARIYLTRQLSDRVGAALAVLAAAAEIHPDGVEWEPQERRSPPGPGVRARTAALDGLRPPGPSHRSLEKSFDVSSRPIGCRVMAGMAPVPFNRSPGSGLESVSKRDFTGLKLASKPATALMRIGHRTANDRSILSLPCSYSCSAAGHHRDDACHAGLVPRGLERRDLAAPHSCADSSHAALAPLMRLVESAKGLDATDPVGPWKRLGPMTSSINWDVPSTTSSRVCTSLTKHSSGSAAMPHTSCGRH